MLFHFKTNKIKYKKDRIIWIKQFLIMILLALITGVLMGIISILFLNSLAYAGTFRERYPHAIYFIPIACILTALVYQKFGKGTQRGNNLVIDSVNRDAKVPLRMSVFTFVFTLLTHFSGGSAGREGTAVQIGGSITNRLARLFKLENQNKRILVMAGISAGFGSVFGTPFAGVIFGMEMCFVGKLEYKALFPCFIASFVGNFIAELLGVTHQVYQIASVPTISYYLLATTIIASCVFGLVGKYFSISITFLKNFYTEKIKNYMLKALITGVLVLGLILIFQTSKYNGLSTWMIASGFDGTAEFFDPIKKFLLTVMTLGAGFQGGEATPLFDIGASLGGYIGQLFNIEPSLFAAIGLICVFGSAANTPITTLILGIEMFGFKALPYYIIATLISYFITGHNGIYSAQVIVTPKRTYYKHHREQRIEDIKRIKI